MGSQEIQYISLIKIDKNIKLDHQIFINDTIKNAEQFIFPLDNGEISYETVSKLKELENTSKKTIITAICEDKDQIVLDKKISRSRGEVSIVFDDTNNIVLDKEKLKKVKKIYNDVNIDYLISPFTILNEELIQNKMANSLNIFIFNNNLYSILLDENKEIIFNAIGSITPYCDIKKSNFYADEISEQILYDEIYLLELGNNISSILNLNKGIAGESYFCETVNIFYAIKYLETKQINILKDTISININYTPICIDDSVDSIVKKENIKQYSFTKKRINKAIYLKILVSMILMCSLFGVGYIIYKSDFFSETQNIINSNKKIAKIEYANLPNHSVINQKITRLIKNLLEVIDDESILKEIQVLENESTIIYNFKEINNYEKILKPRLLQFYEKSENILTSKEKDTYTSIISNTHIVEKNESILKKYIPSKNTKFLSSNEAKIGIEQIFNSNTIVKLLSEKKDKYTQYKYSVHTIIKSPNDFFEVIALLEQQEYSVVLDYPIGFAKTNKGLELNFRLTVNQNNK